MDINVIADAINTASSSIPAGQYETRTSFCEPANIVYTDNTIPTVTYDIASDQDTLGIWQLNNINGTGAARGRRLSDTLDVDDWTITIKKGGTIEISQREFFSTFFGQPKTEPARIAINPDDLSSLLNEGDVYHD